MPEEVAEIEAIADAGREDPGIDIGIAFDIDAAKGRVVAPGDGGIEPGLLHVGVGIPAIAERNVETCLQREAERIVDAALCDTAALNPDTLSRIMSRLRGRGIFSPDGRSQIMLRDFPALAARSPAAQALAEIHGDSIARPRRAGTMR